MESADREVRLERVAKGIARVISLRHIQEDNAVRSKPFGERLKIAKEMADHIWRDVLMEAEAAIEAYPDPVEIEA